VGDIDRTSTLAQAADAFLAHSPPEERGKAQSEVFKFVRWLGSSRQVQDISPVDVASYGEQITQATAKPLRSFLAYIRKQSSGSIALAPHLRAKKPSPKTVVAWQSSPVQITLTPEGHAKLEKELANLRNQRAQVIEDIQKAAADKDFRENAPLAAAREQKAHVEGRIKEIESTLNQAKIVGEGRDTTTAKLGDTVVLRDLSADKESTYTLVDSREANPIKGRLSVASPLGKAISGKQIGQTLEVAAPAGTMRCRIENIVAPSSRKKDK
jgi:transcription elongation factor GreA